MYLCNPVRREDLYNIAEIAQLVEHDLAKVGVASSSLVFRSRRHQKWCLFFIPSLSQVRGTSPEDRGITRFGLFSRKARTRGSWRYEKCSENS